MNVSEIDAQRFWRKVDVRGADDCWLWTGELNNKGYGRIRLDLGRVIAHRLAYALAFGEIAEGQVVRHDCDTPRCCNANHMRLGTQVQNIQDMHDRGRFNDCGLRAGWDAKYKRQADQILLARSLIEQGLSRDEVAEQMGRTRNQLFQRYTKSGPPDLAGFFRTGATGKKAAA